MVFGHPNILFYKFSGVTFTQTCDSQTNSVRLQVGTCPWHFWSAWRLTNNIARAAPNLSPLFTRLWMKWILNEVRTNLEYDEVAVLFPNNKVILEFTTAWFFFLH